MANDRPVHALSTLRARLEEHARTVPALGKAFGLDKTLSALDAALVEQARRQAELASAVSALERAVNRIAPAGSPPIFTDAARERLAEIVVAARDL